jgi:hypothetical protein
MLGMIFAKSFTQRLGLLPTKQQSERGGGNSLLRISASKLGGEPVDQTPEEVSAAYHNRSKVPLFGRQRSDLALVLALVLALALALVPILVLVLVLVLVMLLVVVVVLVLVQVLVLALALALALVLALVLVLVLVLVLNSILLESVKLILVFFFW